jgi:acyl-CoA thioester hydrolase
VKGIRAPDPIKVTAAMAAVPRGHHVHNQGHMSERRTSIATELAGRHEMTVTYRGTVYPWQCDHMGHMNVMWYVGKFDEASWQLLSTLGLTASRFRREGIRIAAVDQHIEYKRELYAGDVVTVRSTVLAVTEKSIRIAHEMRHDETGEIAAVTILVGVHLDRASTRARALPSDVRECAMRMMAELALPAQS